jgi:hypothetical protein
MTLRADPPIEAARDREARRIFVDSVAPPLR